MPAHRQLRSGRRRHRVLRGVSHRRPGAAQRLHPRGTHDRPHHREPPGPVPGDHALLQSGAQRFAGRRRECREQGEGRDRIAAQHSGARFRARPQAFQASLANEPVLILAALVTVYIVLGVLYESYIHPITILSTLPSAGVGALLALNVCRPGFQRDRADRHRAADRHREEERHHDDRFRAGRRAQGRHAAASTPSIRPACCASAPS